MTEYFLGNISSLFQTIIPLANYLSFERTDHSIIVNYYCDDAIDAHDHTRVILCRII